MIPKWAKAEAKNLCLTYPPANVLRMQIWDDPIRRIGKDHGHFFAGLVLAEAKHQARRIYTFLGVGVPDEKTDGGSADVEQERA